MRGETGTYDKRNHIEGGNTNLANLLDLDMVSAGGTKGDELPGASGYSIG